MGDVWLVPTGALGMGAGDVSSGSEGWRLRLPPAMAAHQRAAEIYKTSCKIAFKVSGLLILLLQENASNVHTRKTHWFIL